MIIEHLKQESTWRGIIAVAIGLGIQLAPELQESIIALGMAGIGMINILKNK
jgi:hypothetical protein